METAIASRRLKAAVLFALSGLIFAGTLIGLWSEVRYKPFLIDEVVNTSAAVNLLEHGEYRNDTPYGLGSEPFSSYITSGFAATWPGAAGWKLGHDLSSARLASIVAAVVFAGFLGLRFFSLLSLSLPVASAATAFVWFLLVQVPPDWGFVCNHAELQGALWLALGALLLPASPAAGAFCLGTSVWLCKLIYLPAACAVAISHWTKARKSVLAFMFLLPLQLWVALILVTCGGQGVRTWIGKFPYYSHQAYQGQGVETPASHLGLAGRLLFAGDQHKVLFWSWLLIPAAVFLLSTARGRLRPPKRELRLFGSAVAAICFYYSWFLVASPVMYDRHIQPGIYVSVLATVAMIASQIRSGRITGSWLRPAGGILLFCAAALSGARAWDGIRSGAPVSPIDRLDEDRPEVMSSMPEIGIFRTLLSRLRGSPQGPGPHALFAPVDTALFRAGAGVPQVMFDKNTFHDHRWDPIVKHHQAERDFSPEQLGDGEVIPMRDCNGLRFTRRNGRAFVDGASILKVVRTRSGTLYVIDSLLFPKSSGACYP